jgi:hypothetical protein
MKNNRIVKTLQWGIGGMLILIGLGTILLPVGTHTAHAASVQIKDDARVLDVNQVRSFASQLPHAVSISTTSTFNGPKSDFSRSTEQALTDQRAIAIGISIEQRYLAIVAGKEVGLHADQIEQARQAFAQAYGRNAGANGNYTAATVAALQSLQASLGNDGVSNPLQSVHGVLSNPLIWLLVLGLIGAGFFVVRHFSRQRKMMNPPLGMPWQQGYNPKDEYGRIEPDPGYGRPPYDEHGYGPHGYGRPLYGPGYPPQGGINPWVAGGLGALGGGFLGYELGRMAGEHDQQAQGGDSMNPDTITPLSQGSNDPGMRYPADTIDGGNEPDFGDFGGEGADFGGGGDFGGDW